MNFLAHIYLSGEDVPLMMGNFMGDFIKGNEYKKFSPAIQKGILLHREIDFYTDSHGIVLESKKRLRRKYRHYAGVITDIYYDHFLASNWHAYHKKDLRSFTEEFYRTMDENRSLLPDKVNYVLYHMKKDNWLYHYRTLEGIGRALYGLSRRTKFNSKMDESVEELEKDYELYKEEFDSFFPELTLQCEKFIRAN
ncbi:MAG: acyl carrier protein phosphodiesterase [Cyclobacteriaceae bacterium]